MAGIAEFVSWCQREIQKQTQQIEMMKTGKMKVHTRTENSPLTDVTENSIKETELKIKELEDLIALHAPS